MVDEKVTVVKQEPCMEISKMPDWLNYSTKTKQLLEKNDEVNYM